MGEPKEGRGGGRWWQWPETQGPGSVHGMTHILMKRVVYSGSWRSTQSLLLSEMGRGGARSRGGRCGGGKGWQ